MEIHFVCYGNTFRSRLAEAYFKSRLKELGISNVTVSSSGTRADGNHHGPISWYALRILVNNSLIPYMKNVWTVTSQDQLDSADAIIFVHDSVYESVKDMVDSDSSNYKVWDVEDVSNEEVWKTARDQDDFDLQMIHQTEEIFEKIKNNVDDLVDEISKIVKTKQGT